MDNCINDILDTNIKHIEYTNRNQPSLTYYFQNSQSNNIINKTMDILHKSPSQEGLYNYSTSNQMCSLPKNKPITQHKKTIKSNGSFGNITVNNQPKSKNINWEKQYEALRLKTEQAKKNLVNERIKAQELEKQFSRLNKKEKQYNELIESNKTMLQENEALYQKVIANEQIAHEQEQIINSLQLEIMRFKGIYDETDNNNDKI